MTTALATLAILPRMNPLNIGISISSTDSSNIWNNGINQNIAFLGMLLRKSPVVGKVWFVHSGEAATLPPGMQFDGIDIPVVKPQDVIHEIDILIEMGAILPLEWMRRIHARGAKIVCFGVGHNYNAVAETTAFAAKQTGIHLTDPTLRVETWGLPQHTKSCAPMMKTLTRKPVVEMPHIWSPYFLDKTIGVAEEKGHAFGFDPTMSGEGKGGWKVAIFEPNIAVGKNCWIPILICDQACRTEAEAIQMMWVMNSFHMKEHPTFLRFALNLDLTQHHKASYEGRLQFTSVMAEHGFHAVVAHHWEWGQNYLYYDALYGGYPLIHNSEFLKEAGVGIYYPGFSAGEGSKALINAWQQPVEYWQDYKRKAAEYVATLHPEHPENIRIFTERLLHVRKAN
jgi:hypothetical protein